MVISRAGSTCRIARLAARTRTESFFDYKSHVFACKSLACQLASPPYGGNWAKSFATTHWFSIGNVVLSILYTLRGLPDAQDCLLAALLDMGFGASFACAG
jgi:hypothetical protein